MAAEIKTPWRNPTALKTAWRKSHQQIRVVNAKQKIKSLVSRGVSINPERASTFTVMQMAKNGKSTQVVNEAVKEVRKRTDLAVKGKLKIR